MLVALTIFFEEGSSCTPQRVGWGPPKVQGSPTRGVNNHTFLYFLPVFCVRMHVSILLFEGLHP